MRIELMFDVYETTVINPLYDDGNRELVPRIELRSDEYKSTVISHYTIPAKAKMSKMPHLNYVL